ncbi:MAG TPA: hypothetical protein VEG34_13325 [Thermoanaerobaculia bacterium]|nr:hypothetical protein [Thermoanaerobaculia bacterium]
MRPSTRSLRSLIPSITALALLVAAPAAAQFSQYTAPGSLLQRSTSKKEQMDRALENARWHWGPFRLSPWIAIRDAAYVSDAFSGSSGEPGGPSGAAEEDPDFTITLGAGLQGYVPFGSKTFFTFDVLPQYVWWQEQEERRRLNGYYGAGLFAFFNRLNAEVTVRRAEEQGVLTPEFEQRIHSRQERIAGTVELEITPALFAFVSADAFELGALTEDIDDPRLPPFHQLDRQERVLRGGLEYRSGDRLRLGVGVERSEVEFDPGHAGNAGNTGDIGRDRSNTGTSPIVEAVYAGPRIQLEGGLAFRSLEPEPGSEFVPFDETTGRVQASWTPRWRLSYSLYGTRGLDYSLDESYSHFTEDRLGLGISSRVGRTSSVNLFAETGAHDYVISGLASGPGSGLGEPGALPREDDFTAYGTSIQLQLEDRVRLSLGVARTELESNFPGVDRSLTVFQTSVEISAFGGAFTVR